MPSIIRCPPAKFILAQPTLLFVHLKIWTSYVQRPMGLIDLTRPLWVPNWAATKSDRPEPYRHNLPKSLYIASGTQTADAHILCKDGALQVCRICIGYVHAISKLTEMDSRDDYYHAITAFHAWHKFLSSKLGHDIEQRKSFSGLLLCEQIGP